MRNWEENKMANMLEGYISGKGLKIGIVAARFNEFITSRLLSGALDALHRHETADSDILSRRGDPRLDDAL